MGHQAQVTIQVCLQDAIFAARYRASMIESEDLLFKDEAKYKPQSVAADLRLRGEIYANVIRVLQMRKQAIEQDILNQQKKGA